MFPSQHPQLVLSSAGVAKGVNQVVGRWVDDLEFGKGIFEFGLCHDDTGSFASPIVRHVPERAQLAGISI